MDGRSSVGVGIYTVPQAARLTGVSSSRIRRWLKGYEFDRGGERRKSVAVWRAQLEPLDHELALGFLDLMEIRFVDAFLKAGLSWPKIRKAATQARELVGLDHPFSTKKFRTDGKRILAEIERGRSGDKAMLDLERQQLGFYDVIVPSLLRGVDFDEHGQAARWRPFSADVPLVVIDPARQFGQPIVDPGGVQTSTLADAVRADSIETVAKWFEIPTDAVTQAVEFEFRLAA